MRLRSLYTLAALVSVLASARATRLRDLAPLRHTVAHWPAGAAPTRWIVRIRVDADIVRLGLPFNQTDGLCILHERSGQRVRNQHVSAPAATPHDGTAPAALSQEARGKKLVQYLLQEVRSSVVFEPVAGPGEYELYVGCAADAEGAPPDDAFLAIATAPAAERLPPVHIAREEERAAVGPEWPAPSDGWNGHRHSYGNVRARLLVGDVAAGNKAVRCRVEWRRRRGSKVDTQLYLFHASRPDERVRNVLLAVKGSVESTLVFEPTHGPGEYLLYYLPHTSRWQTFDGRDDLQSTAYEPLAAEHDPEWFMSHVGGLDNVSRLAAASHFDTQARPNPNPSPDPNPNPNLNPDPDPDPNPNTLALALTLT